MKPSVRQGEQRGQMLVAVIVLLALMFFIGSAMALAVSSSLHTIAQTNSMDSSSYAAESAVAQGLAINQPGSIAPRIDHAGGGGNTTWGYTYEVVGSGGLLGRSEQAVDRQGVDNPGSGNHETITIINPPGAVSFELYRTIGGPSRGYLGTFAADPRGSTAIDDLTSTGDQVLKAKPAPPMCTSPTRSSLPTDSNKYKLTASTCRVPVDGVAGALHTWTGAARVVQGGGACSKEPLGFSPGGEPGTIWGVIGWHSLTATAPKLGVSVENSCDPDGPKCSTRTSIVPGQQNGVLHYWCNVDTHSQTDYLRIINTGAKGGDADVSAFVVRAAPSGTDCLVTVAGQAGPVANEADSQLAECSWSSVNRTLWNRVLS